MAEESKKGHPEKEGPEVPRRDVVDYLVAGSLVGLGGSVLYPVMHYFVPPPVKEVAAGSVVAARVDELPSGSGKIFNFGGRPAILVRTPTGAYRAFSAVCTHLGCTVQYRADLGHIWCACHDGHYDLNGQVLAGPPPRPLPEYVVTLKGQEVIVSRPS